MRTFLHEYVLELFFKLVPFIKINGTKIHYKEIIIHANALPKNGNIYF